MECGSSSNKQERDLQLQQSQRHSASRSRLPSAQQLPQYPQQYPQQLPPSHPNPHSYAQSPAPVSHPLARSNSRDQYPPQPHHSTRPRPPSPASAPKFDPNAKGSLWDQPVPDTNNQDQDSEMAPRNATLITPGDPSARPGIFSSQASTSKGGYGRDNGRRGGNTSNFKAAGGGGKVNNQFFGDSDDEDNQTHQASSNGKGKGKGKEGNGNGNARGGSHLLQNAMSAATASTNTAHKGKGASARNGQGSVVSQMAPIQKKGKVPLSLLSFVRERRVADLDSHYSPSENTSTSHPTR